MNRLCIIFFNLELYLPEIIIFLGSLLCIVIGAFSKNKNYNKVYILSIFAFDCFSVFILFSDTYFIWIKQSIYKFYIYKCCETFVIGISIAILYVSHGYIKNNKLNLFEYPILLLFAVLGMLIMLSSNDLLLTIYIHRTTITCLYMY